MKILHVINGLTSGGAERLVCDIACMASDDAHEISVLCLSSRHDVYTEAMRKQGIKVCCLSGGTVYNPLLLCKLFAFFRKHTFDIVHVHLFPSFYFMALLKQWGMKSKLIYHEHNTLNGRINSRFWRFWDKKMYASYARIICISDAVKAVLQRVYALDNRQLTVICNGVDIEKCHKATPVPRQELPAGIAVDDKIIIMVARFNPQKDHQTLLKALTMLPEDYKLLLIGEGEMQLQVKQLAVDLGVNDRTFFMGYQCEPARFVKASDVFVLSSVFEGFGLVCVEAMACGTPVIASEVPGMADVVGEVGRLFNVGNAKVLANHILEVMNNPILRRQMVEKGLERAQQYDIHCMTDRLIGLYDSI